MEKILGGEKTNQKPVVQDIARSGELEGTAGLSAAPAASPGVQPVGESGNVEAQPVVKEVGVSGAKFSVGTGVKNFQTKKKDKQKSKMANKGKVLRH